MNHQAIVEQLSALAPALRESKAPEEVLIKYANERNLSPAQLERIGQVYNIAKTLNFMDKSANRGDSFKVLDNEKMLADFTKFKPAETKSAVDSDWASWFDAPSTKSASTHEKQAKIVEEDGQFVVYNEDGTKKLSKAYAQKGHAVKRLQQIEYFKSHKQASSMPNINALANDEDYSTEFNTHIDDLPAASGMREVKSALYKESIDKYELDTVDQVIDDARTELFKTAKELLEMHKVSPLPFAVMEGDAVYASQNPGAVKAATELVAGYFKEKGWNVERYDFSSAAPKLARDRHNALPLFKSIADNIDNIKAASAYKEDFKKKANPAPLSETIPGFRTKPRRVSGNRPPAAENETVPGFAGKPRAVTPDADKKKREAERKRKEEEGYEDDRWAAMDQDSRGEKPKEGDKSTERAISDTKDVLSAGAEVLNPATYASQMTKDYITNMMRAPTPKSFNDRQHGIDTSREDVGRATGLQRLMLSDPIIGEADPDTVVGLYNTLANANPEIVKDPNLLRLALREAIQYEAVPLHTYKDLITMRKERGQAEDYEKKTRDDRYSI